MNERPITVELKSAPIPPFGVVRWSWWATVDNHPFSDQRGYETADAARDAANAWTGQYYPAREVVYSGGN